MKRSWRILLLAGLLLALVSAPAHAEGDGASDTGRKVYDALLLRPLSFVRTVVSVALFPVFYPFALPFGAGDEVIEICITQPVDRTFRRPLGDL